MYVCTCHVVINYLRYTFLKTCTGMHTFFHFSKYVGRGALFGFARGAWPFVGGISLSHLQVSPQHGNSVHTGHPLIFRSPRSSAATWSCSGFHPSSISEACCPIKSDTSGPRSIQFLHAGSTARLQIRGGVSWVPTQEEVPSPVSSIIVYCPLDSPTGVSLQ